MQQFVFNPGDTSQTVDLFFPDSSSTTGAGLSGLVFNSSGLTAYYRKGATGTPTAVTLATQTVGGAYSSGGFVETDATHMKGMYRFDIPDTILAAAGKSFLYFYGAANLAPVPVQITVGQPANVAQWNGTNVATPATAGIPDVNLKNAAGTAVTLDANNVLNVSTKYVGGTLQTAGDIPARLPAALTAGGFMKSDPLAINGVSTSGVTTVKPVIGLTTADTITTLTNLPSIPANWLTAAGINAGALNGKGDWGTATNLGTVLTRVTTALPSVAPGGANGLPILGNNTAGITLAPASGNALTLDANAGTGLAISAGAKAVTIASIADVGMTIAGGGGSDAIQVGSEVGGGGVTDSGGVRIGGDNGYAIYLNDAGGVNDIKLANSSAPTLATAIVGAAGAALTAVAPASTALSSAVYTNARAAKLDNLDAAVTSRAATGDAMTLTSAYDFAKGTVAVTESYNADGAAPTPVQALMVIMQMLTEMSISGTTMTINKLNGSTAFTLTLSDGSTPTSVTRAT